MDSLDSNFYSDIPDFHVNLRFCFAQQKSESIDGAVHGPIGIPTSSTIFLAATFRFSQHPAMFKPTNALFSGLLWYDPVSE